MIKIIDFAKHYYNFPQKNPVFSVDNINLEINDGEIVALLGPNGSGKTTILKALCGLHCPSNGKIIISDTKNQLFDTQDYPEKILENLGYVPEISVLPKDLIVIDFLYYVASVHNIAENQKQKAIDSVIEKCALEKVLNKKIKKLSKGYKQRVSFAQALIHNPKNLILDEPITGLDPAQIVQIRTLIKELSKDKAILISTHILQEVTYLCSRAFIINNGQLLIDGSEEEIIAKTNTKTFEEAFISLTKNEQLEGDNEK